MAEVGLDAPVVVFPEPRNFSMDNAMSMRTKIITVNSRGFLIMESGSPAGSEGALADLLELQTRIESDAGDHNALFLLGRAYTNMGRLNDAVDAFTRATEVNSHEATYYFHLAQCYLALKNFAEAVRYSLTALSLDNRFTDAHLLAGFALIQLNRLRKAIAHFDAALKINPNLTSAYMGIGHSYSLMGWHDKALRCLDRALKQHPNNARIHADIGCVFERAHRFDEAVASFMTALELDEENDVAHAHLAFVLAILGKFKESQRHSERAVQLNPDHLAFLINTLVQSGLEVDAEKLKLAEDLLATPNPSDLHVREL